MGAEPRQDHVGPTLCFECEHFSGCRHLRKKGVPFIPENVIVEGDEGVCRDYDPAGELEMSVRRQFVGMAQGLVSLRALYYRSEPSVADPEEAEEEEMIEDVPDFEGMLYGDDGDLLGLTVAEREDQLRYLTDESGNPSLDDDGNKVPRGCFPVRKYAEDPEGPVAPRIAETLNLELDSVPGVVRFWKTNELVPAVIRAEYDSGLIIAKSGKKAAAPAKAKAAQTKKKDVDQMAARQRIMVNRTKKKTSGGEDDKPKGPAKKGPVTNKKTTSKKGPAKKAPNKAKAPASEEEASSSGGSSVDLSAVLGLLKDIKKEVAANSSAIEEMKDYLDQQVQTCVTLNHDATLQKLNELGGAIGMAFGEVSEEAGQAIWESGAVPLDEKGESLQADAQNLLSGPDGEQHSILLYLEQTGGDDDEGEEEGDDE